MSANFRFHRGGLKESLATSVRINSLDDLCKLFHVGPKRLRFEYYGYDERIDKHCYIVSVSLIEHSDIYLVKGFIDNLNFKPPSK